MLKATAEVEGRRIVLLGIDKENVRRLKNDEPIKVSLDEMRIPENIDVYICYGDTLDDLVEKLQPAISFKTEIIYDKDLN